MSIGFKQKADGSWVSYEIKSKKDPGKNIKAEAKAERIPQEDAVLRIKKPRQTKARKLFGG